MWISDCALGSVLLTFMLFKGQLYYPNTNQRKAGVATISYFNTKNITETESFHNDKGVSSSQSYNILNVYALNNRDSKCKKQKLRELQGETDKTIIIVS